MNDKKQFVMAHDEARRRAVAAVVEAPAGWRVTVEPPKRNLDQNALLWVLLSAFAEQLEWPVNGRMVKLTADDWKDLLTAAYRRETQRVAMGIDGGMVMLGMRTSKLNKREFAELIEFIQSVAVDRGVELDEVVA
jgi:hypothetical protein